MRIELGAETLTARSFGAIGNGLHDDTAALQAAADWLRSHRVLIFEPGIYRVTDTLDITRADGQGSYTSIALKGAETGASGPHGTVLLWDGPPDRTMVRLWARDSLVEGIAFRCATGRTLQSAIDVSKSREGTMVTNVGFRRVQILALEAESAFGGEILRGIRVGTTFESGSNLEHFHLEDCYFISCREAGYSIESIHAQAKSHEFRRCHWRWLHDDTPTGTAIDVYRGSVQTFGCTFIRVERFLFVGAAVDNIVVHDSDSEWVKRIFETRTVSPEHHLPVLFVGGRYNLSGLKLATAHIPAEETDYIRHGMQGSLVIQGCAFRKGLAHIPEFRIRGYHGTRTASTGNAYPNPTPFVGNITPHSVCDSAMGADGFYGLLDHPRAI